MSANTNPLSVDTTLEKKWSKNKLKTPQHILEKKGIRPEAIEQEQRDIGTRKTLFFFLCLLQLVMNFDSGIVPASLTALKKEFDMTDTELGALGSLVYIGLVCSCPLTGYLLTTWKSQRKVLLLSIFLNMIALVIFVTVPSKGLLMFSRFLTGLSQAPLFVYPPVWVDEFAPDDSLTTWVSSLQGMAPLGVMLGYLFSFIFTESFKGPESMGPTEGPKWGWRVATIIQIVLLIPFFFMYVKMPGRFFNSKGGELGRLVDQHKKITKSKQNLLNGTELSDAKPGNESKTRSMRANSKAVELTICQQLCKLLSSALYMRLVFALSGLYFIVTGIQFWATIYMVEKVGADPLTVKTGFVLTSITGPLIGVFFGGWLIDRLGGYKDDSGQSGVVALKVCSYLGAGAVLFACISAFTLDFWVVLVSIWLVLFFGGAILPALTGIIINAVGEECKNMASSFSMFMYNIVGYAMAPFLSGVVSDAAKDMVWGWRLIMLMSIPSILCAVLAYFAIKSQVETAAKEDAKKGSGRRGSLLTVNRNSEQVYRIRSVSRSADYHVGQEDDDANLIDTTSSIARALNKRGSVAPNFFGFLDKMDNSGPSRDRNISEVKKNSTLGAIDEDDEEEDDNELEEV
jgi:MFS transporter, Spinster family, sphingosine-1-phosphate transporter